MSVLTDFVKACFVNVYLVYLCMKGLWFVAWLISRRKKDRPHSTEAYFLNVISEVWSLLLMVCLFSLSFVFSCCFQRLVNWVCDCSISYIKELLWPRQSPWRSNTNMTSWNRMMTTDTIGWQNWCVHTVKPVIF